jgi:hypothetical protein
MIAAFRLRSYLASACVGSAAVLALLVSARPAAAQDRAIVVLPLSLVGRVPAGRPALEAAVAKGIAVAAKPIVGADEVATQFPASRNGACDAPACWREVGRALDAAYLVAGLVERRGGFFHATFRLIEPGSGRALANEHNECDENECSVAELCRMTARELVRQTLAGAPVAEAVAPPPAVVPPAPPASASLVKAAPPSARPRLAKVLPIAAIVAGAVAIGIGAYVLKADGECQGYTASMECKGWNENSHGAAWAAIGGGTALAATGLVFLLRTPSGANASVAVSPGRLLLSGRF